MAVWVTNEIPNNCVVAGWPGRVVRRDVAWERPHLTRVQPFYKLDMPAIARSDYWDLTADLGAPDHALSPEPPVPSAAPAGPYPAAPTSSAKSARARPRWRSSLGRSLRPVIRTLGVRPAGRRAPETDTAVSGTTADDTEGEETGTEPPALVEPELVDLVPWSEQSCNELVRVIARELAPRPRAKVVIHGGASAEALETYLLGRYPGLQIVCLTPDANRSASHVRLSISNPYNMIIDVSEEPPAKQVQDFEQTFMHLGRGGAYVVREVRVSDVAAEPPGPRRDLAVLLSRALATPYRADDPVSTRDLYGLAVRFGAIRNTGAVKVIRNIRRARPKLREAEANAVLEARPDLGSLLQTVPGGSFTSRCDYHEGPGSAPDPAALPTVFEVPPVHLRLYHEAVCGRGQIVESQGLLLPDTYRHNQSWRLSNVYVNEVAARFGEVRTALGDPIPLGGAFFHFDSEWPGHFGHMMSEQLSRLWAFDSVRQREPEVRLLTSLPKDRIDGRLRPWELSLLAPFGIEEDDVVIYDSSVRVERLYAATPMFSCPNYVHPDITEIWRTAGDFLYARADADRSPGPKRVFCSRRAGLKRACRNADEVEALFVAHGFTVINPEDHPIEEQVALFRDAAVIAGFAGSALFTMAMCPTPKTIIILSPRSYTATNEYVFASAGGHRLFTVWSEPDVSHPAGRWTVEAFSSSFAFDFDAEGRYLRDVLIGLDREANLSDQPAVGK